MVAILAALISLVVFYAVYFLVVLSIIKFCSKSIMRFWGADFYTFDLEKRKRVVAIISAILSVITTVIFVVSTFL